MLAHSSEVFDIMKQKSSYVPTKTTKRSFFATHVSYNRMQVL